jgi:hypothetical protein
MAFHGHASWTPLETGDGGDLGTTYRPVDLSKDDTAYYGHGEEDARKDSFSAPPYDHAIELHE